MFNILVYNHDIECIILYRKSSLVYTYVYVRYVHIAVEEWNSRNIMIDLQIL